MTVYTNEKVFTNEIVIFHHLILMVNFSYNIDKIAFIFNTTSGFLFQFEPCIIYCFHE